MYRQDDCESTGSHEDFLWGEPQESVWGCSQMPATRMAIASMLREELHKARIYWQKKRHTEDTQKEPFETDFRLEPWIPVLEKQIPLKAHAHRADDILTAIRIAKEYDLDMTLDHCTEGHLIVDEIKESGYPAICGPHLANRNKIEICNADFKTPGILAKKGILVSMMTDHPVSLIQYLPLCASYAVKKGMEPKEALKAITVNAARICKVADRVGSLQPGLDADIVVFQGNPLKVESEVRYTTIDGIVVYDRVEISLDWYKTDIGGRLELDKGQALTVGTKDYNWTFTPDRTYEQNYKKVTGTISLDVVQDTLTSIETTGTNPLTKQWEIEKANLTGTTNPEVSTRYSNRDTQTITANAFQINMPGTFALKQGGSVTDSNNVLNGAVSYGADIKYSLKDNLTASAVGNTVTVPVTFTPTSTNYKPIDLTLTIKIADKDNVTISGVTISGLTDGSRTYNGNAVTNIDFEITKATITIKRITRLLMW